MSEVYFNRIKKIVSDKFHVSESSLSGDTNLVNDLGADSIDMIEVIVDLEKEFNIEIPDDKNNFFININSASQFIKDALVERKL